MYSLGKHKALAELKRHVMREDDGNELKRRQFQGTKQI
jgi:hypothetical protein